MKTWQIFVVVYIVHVHFIFMDGVGIFLTNNYCSHFLKASVAP